MTFPLPDTPARLRPCIVGIGETEYARRGGIDKSELALCLQAIRAAAEDAGIAPAEIDGYASFGFERHEPAIVQTALAAPLLRYSSLVWGGGGGGCSGAVMLAAMAVATGQCRYAVVYRSICQGQFERYGEYRPARPTWNSYMAPFGLMSPGQMVALTYRRFMERAGMTPDHLAEIALGSRDNAQANPRAVTHGRPLTREQYFASRMIADPFRLYDCCLETDGACAVIVAPAEVAQQLGRPAVPILAAAQASGARWSLGPMGSHNMPIEDYGTINSREVAKAIYAQSGLRPSDIRVAQIYDAFTGLIPMALDDYGLCATAELPSFIASGQLRHDGALPVNTAGGLLSEAYLHGLNLVLEGVRQVRGTSTRQVAGASNCLVTSGGGAGHKSALLLGQP
jgi:acetyl-CoA acetyltransferase